MFSGIVQHVGTVRAATRCQTGKTLEVETGGWGRDAAQGASIAVNGCCLTVAGPPGPAGELRFDVIQQTLDVTALGDLAAGKPVNLESAVTPATLLSGHLVQGHVDGVGLVQSVAAADADYRLRIEPPGSLMELIVDKGSIAVDGVSLTVAALGPTWFEVALIPTTRDVTTLGTARAGDAVNLEGDYVAKIVVSWLQKREAAEP